VSELSIGTRVLERYRIVRPLGRGGMGVVYLARTEGAAGFTRPVVIKSLHGSQSDDRENNEMFAREARILANLQHPNIVSVVDFGREESAYVMVLEYVHGYDLDQWLRFVQRTRGRLGYEYVLYIVRKVLLALQHAHEVRQFDGTPANIVHRDVSLSNVLLDTGGQVKLHDFGIARMDGGCEAPTQTGIFKGKLSLAAPELLKGEKATRRSDIYTTAVMTYHLLSGDNPFKGKSEAETIFRILELVPPPLSARFGDLPRGLDAILARALERDPAARFQTAAQFAEALEDLSTRSDEAVLQDLTRQLRDDFAAIPKLLGLESLTAREAAWREAEDGVVSALVPLSSSPPPEVVPRQVGASTRPQRRAAAQVPTQSVSTQPARHGSSPGMKTIVGLFGIGLAALAVLFLVLKRSPAEPAPRYLVIEKPAASVIDTTSAGSTASSGTAARATAMPESALPPSTNALAGAPSAPSRAAGSKTAGKGSPARPNAESLSRQFKAHQPEIEACFRRNAEQIEGRPQVSIRFEVGRSGKVMQASLSPTELAGTKLGRCLLGVAGAARFDALTEPVAFGIPITARITERGQ
jgi:eukaryotic-like serine/threonine-protein kinase